MEREGPLKDCPGPIPLELCLFLWQLATTQDYGNL